MSSPPKPALSVMSDSSPSEIAEPTNSQADAIFRSATTRSRLNPDEKAAIARAWVESARSGSAETQAAFASRHGLSSPRILRAWVRRFVPATRWEPELRQAIKTAITSLSSIAQAMDRMTDGLSEPSSAQPPPTTGVPAKGKRGPFVFDDEASQN